MFPFILYNTYWRTWLLICMSASTHKQDSTVLKNCRSKSLCVCGCDCVQQGQYPHFRTCEVIEKQQGWVQVFLLFSFSLFHYCFNESSLQSSEKYPLRKRLSSSKLCHIIRHTTLKFSINICIQYTSPHTHTHSSTNETLTQTLTLVIILSRQWNRQLRSESDSSCLLWVFKITSKSHSKLWTTNQKTTKLWNPFF